MNPTDYEALVANYFRENGYTVQVTQMSGDYGIDVIAERGGERIAIQAKMYGGSASKVNRKVVMELSGAMKYANCTSAAIFTNGAVLEDAASVAKKIGVKIVHFDPRPTELPSPAPTQPISSEQQDEQSKLTFDEVWEKRIKLLQGENIGSVTQGRTSRVVRVDWGGMDRITSNGKPQRINIDVFRRAIESLLAQGRLKRQDIKDLDTGRYSSFVFAVLSQVPEFVLVDADPPYLRYRVPN